MPESEKTLLPVVHAGSIQRLAVAGLLASAVAACSSDTLRFGDNPFANPFSNARADNTTTGSIGYSPSMPVQSAPLDPPVPVRQASPQPNYSAPVNAAAQQAASRVEAVGGTARGWTAQGGSQVYVGTGDTLATLSGRYNVPTAAILAANGLSGANQIAPGQRLVIPVYNAGGGAAPAATATAAASSVRSTVTSAAAPVQQAATHTATKAAGAVSNVSHAVAKPVARAEGSLNDQAARIAKVSTAAPASPPARQVVAALPPVATPAATPKAAVAAAVPKAVAAPKVVEQKPVAAVTPAPAQAKPVAEDRQPEVAAKAAAEDSAGFRWPARGRVINGFGSGNEGINIAVPEGTAVKAAEGGVVAYAGSELKGYGNLVLIRHDNGWVSAYANNGELNVKRGDKVSRGQTIAKSGQTGNVTSPQLHFELRKGSKPVDPVPHLAGL
ncbi:murein DD-endopeptidase MepM/ murein hydrolase activator NlpD [Pseudochelatococcus lubricantis]|uniref:Murein DD-endopeptidase MepM/ murein hydrolase activator NlpD n=1 Tax=Pseudochelatococcus lubricantis TaxID=1538102 RepID=A0ABX0V0M8_9HYPH|nr:peptidoglycan DD-metalloendopeptidase family protein [Pseudochelatococcus lubricantis]NIJ57815.1 murein DD-endopeptidase MepM/ murein hydrolase activator NlpD [Pseudochelatococcus lubricantis]